MKTEDCPIYSFIPVVDTVLCLESLYSVPLVTVEIKQAVLEEKCILLKNNVKLGNIMQHPEV